MKITGTPCARLRANVRIRSAVREGTQALAKRHRHLLARPTAYVCSANLDGACSRAEPQAARWDYVLATASACVGMEVHPAKSSEVEVVLQKKRWASSLLEHGLHVASWHWIVPPSSRIQFTPIGPHARRLAQGGVEFPRRRLE